MKGRNMSVEKYESMITELERKREAAAWPLGFGKQTCVSFYLFEKHS
jgi:hypothetical protein